MKEGDVNVPSKTHVPVISVILVTLGTTLGAFGIAQIMSLFSLFSTSFTTYITNSLGWDSTVSAIFIGVIFLVFAVLAFWSSKHFIKWSNQIKTIMGSNIDAQPKNFYALSVVPTEYIVDHMITKRGCKAVEDPDGKGFGLYCPDHPTSDRMRDIINGRYGQFAKGTQLAIILFLNIVVIIPPLVIQEGNMDLTYGPWVWFVFLIIVLLVFYESSILPLWSLVVVYTLHMLIAMILSPEILTIIKIAIPGAIIFFGLVIIIYVFRYDHCKTEKNWWCDRL